MSVFSERLARIRAAGLAPRSKTAPSKKPLSTVSQNSPPEADWERVDAFVWLRRIPHDFVLPDVFKSGFFLPKNTHSKNLLFYDLETTGLSGGTGNTAFLIGFAQCEEGRFTIYQLFLADYPGEAVMLKIYQRFMAERPIHVSYNGVSFDSHVLRTRFLMNRMTFPSISQVDLLFPCRRLWRGRLKSVALQSVEAAVLDFHRFNDIPGADVPEAWFEWLRGSRTDIARVFRHNVDDILSLARLAFSLETWGKVHPTQSAQFPPGKTPAFRGMARQWERTEPIQYVTWLEAGWNRGETECGWDFALHLKRCGEWERARKIWEALLVRDAENYLVREELAKYWEHQCKNPHRALELIEGINGVNITMRRWEALKHRMRRLRAKSDSRRKDGMH